ncbi:MAG: MFS transporter [Angustibacter sp.]
MSDPDTTTSSDAQRWRALAVCLVAAFMTLLDISIVNVALPSIREGLNAQSSELQWIVSGYALTFGLVLVPAGRLGDVWSRRGMFVTGVAVFTVSSVVAGLAPSAVVLVVARLCQGVGGGLLNPQISGLIQEQFRGAERGRAFGYLSAAIGISTAVGPLLGGAIIKALGTDVGWRWIFFINLPVGLACMALAARWVPASRGSGRRGQGLDPVGVALLGASVVVLLLPLVEQQQWKGPVKWLLLPVGALLLLAFVLWERRQSRVGHDPLVDLHLFARRSFSAGTAIGVLYFSGFTSIFFVTTLYLQSGLGLSALQAGLAVTPFAAGSALTAVPAGRLVSRHGRPLVVAGIVAVAVGLALTDAVVAWRGDQASVAWWTAGPLLLAGLGSGFVISPNLTITVSEVPVRQAGAASGVLQTGQRIGTAAGIALVGSVYFSTLAGSQGDAARALSTALRLTVLLLVLALAAGIVDVVRPARSSERDGERDGERSRSAARSGEEVRDPA